MLFLVILFLSYLAPSTANLDARLYQFNLDRRTLEITKNLLFKAFPDEAEDDILGNAQISKLDLAPILRHPEIFTDMKVIDDLDEARKSLLEFCKSFKGKFYTLGKYCQAYPSIVLPLLNKIKSSLNYGEARKELEYNILLAEYKGNYCNILRISEEKKIKDLLKKYDTFICAKLMEKARHENLSFLNDIISIGMKLAESYRDIDSDKERGIRRILRNIQSNSSLEFKESIRQSLLRNSPTITFNLLERIENELNFSPQPTKSIDFPLYLIPETVINPDAFVEIVKLALKLNDGERISEILAKSIIYCSDIGGIRTIISEYKDIISFERSFVSFLLLSNRGKSDKKGHDPMIRYLSKATTMGYLNKLLIWTTCRTIDCLIDEVKAFCCSDLNCARQFFLSKVSLKNMRERGPPSKEEIKIANLTNTSISWDQSNSTDKGVSRNPFTAGWLTAPLDYQREDSPLFKLRIRRHSDGVLANQLFHIIHVEGGPGGKPDYRSDDRLEDYIVFYTFDHRGSYQSGKEALRRPDETKSDSDLCPEHITMFNSAHDIATFIRHIRQSNPNARIVLFADSYGCELVNTFVSLFPNLAEAVILNNSPPIYEITEMETYDEFIIDCTLDKFCRSKMGLDVGRTLDEAVAVVLNENYNGCTAQLHKLARERLSIQDGEKIDWRKFLKDFLMGSSIKKLPSGAAYSTAQILFPLFKSTKDCVDPETYGTVVMDELKKILPSPMARKDEINLGTYPLIQYIDNLGFNDKTPHSPPPHDFNSLYWFRNDATSWQRYKSVYGRAKNLKRTPKMIAKTAYTEFYFTSCRKDLTTPPNSAFDLFKRIEAPIKEWLLNPRCTHGHPTGICTDLFLLQAYFGISLTGIAECLEQKKIHQDRMNLDWSLLKWKSASKMWDLVNDEIIEDQISVNIPGNLEMLPALA